MALPTACQGCPSRSLSGRRNDRRVVSEFPVRRLGQRRGPPSRKPTHLARREQPAVCPNQNSASIPGSRADIPCRRADIPCRTARNSPAGLHKEFIGQVLEPGTIFTRIGPKGDKFPSWLPARRELSQYVARASAESPRNTVSSLAERRNQEDLPSRGVNPGWLRRRLASAGAFGHSRAMAEPDIRATNAPEVTVSELSNALKRAIEDRFGYVRVRGEISGYRGPHSSGHAYFCLKDAGAQLDAVIWRTSLFAHADEARGWARRGGDGQADDLPGQVELPDRHRATGARRPRGADGAPRGAPQEARGRGAVRRGAQAQGSLPAQGRRGRDVADGGGHPRHSPQALRPLPGARRRLAGAGCRARRRRRRSPRRSTASTRSNRAGRRRGRTC